MNRFPQLKRLERAETHLQGVSALANGHGVEALWFDEARRSDPRAVPDALYVNMGDSYAPTIVYDVASGEYLFTSWGDVVEAADAAREAEAASAAEAETVEG